MLIAMDLHNLVLRPNCLLTKSPLVFVPGPRSLLFYRKPFAQLPEFLHQHGYRTIVLSLPFRQKKRRAYAMTKWLNQAPGEKFHFILPKSTYAELKGLISAENTASITILISQPDINDQILTISTYPFVVARTFLARIFTPFYYRIHQFICYFSGLKANPFSVTFLNANRSVYQRFLDHCIKLAENEYYA